ncbi:MAG: alpha/beta fold hydrolase [Polyangia bacterium]|jgi:pimeloyl-ACP methyl ester carboxylesterase
MPRARIGRHTIEFATTGDEHPHALVLITGTAAPLTMWDDEFCEALAGRGFRVVRFDYRDTGRSTSTPGAMPGSIQEMMAAVGEGRLQPSFRLEDLADDVVGLLDAVGIDRAHLLGLSQGGGVAQLVAARAPHRVTALTLVACSTASPEVPPPSPQTMSVLLSALPCDRRSFVDWNVLMYTNTGAKNPPPDVDWIRRRAERTWDHGWTPAGFLRHLLAVITATNRKPLLASVKVPVSIVHGAADPVFPVEAAHQLATAIPGARLTLVPGMGHDLPPPFWPVVFEAVGRPHDAGGNQA